MKTIKFSAFLLACTMAFSTFAFSACGENTSQDSSQSNQSSNSEETTQEEAKKEFDFSKIEWTTFRERDGKELQQVIEFTNNTDYPILKLKITFEQKSDTTAENLKTFDELIKDKKIDEKEVSNIYIVGKCDKFIKQGESKKGSIRINDSYSVKTDEQFSIMEPSEANVEYVDGDKVYVMEYNYLTKKSKVIGEPKQAYKWPEKALGDQIPKLKCEVTSVILDEDTDAIIAGYDYSKSKIDEYVEECKKLGYLIEDSFGNVTFLKKDNIKIEVSYDEVNKTIHLFVETDKSIGTTQNATQ